MVCGWCLANSYRDAAQFVFMLDGLFILMGVWGYLRGNTDDGIAGPQFASACIGLPAGFLAKAFDDTKPRVAVAMILAAAGAASWVYTIFADITWMSTVREKIESGEVTVEGLYWPSQWMSLCILVVIAFNHAILAAYCRRRINHSVGNRPAERDEFDGIL
mmetsp:Transcript_23424/g.59765  ORF Transcript_23424/g.59765 Transcript_23424/m.59765 type:complete len:161 (+) Transcript_23424:62-544(+)|eukprot:CAMPEP_0115848836 /NCGR_PEP_ID=MMETSP0287-20121206/11134_1 /TAXON_ID=412157 /ORGANISM="Chrysochromulina rotalis, Strain UIO044" /LENGTH=160 /DNA_ID=CAMNT_0003302775 /DNA_START=62 /DNA_END=544 /DNA_ORIENTATION=+